ncbi:MAG: hypothetical protein HWN81_00115 [Candidatus Lokiarchaeota archaeon]|nr:hypothetical protein [Candidatus Lokiarchaeota archaeon]
MDRDIARGIARGIASIAVCVAGSFCMYITNSSTGIGWIVLGLFCIWMET